MRFGTRQLVVLQVGEPTGYLHGATTKCDGSWVRGQRGSVSLRRRADTQPKMHGRCVLPPPPLQSGVHVARL